jgi:hypothetical protein
VFAEHRLVFLPSVPCPFYLRKSTYLLNFEGEELAYNPKIIKTKKPTFFKNPKRWFYQKVWEKMTENGNK